MAFNPGRKTFCNAKAKATAKGKRKVKAQAKAKAKANAKAKAKPKAKVKAQAKAKAKEARSAEKILLLQNWRAQRGEKFCNARLGHLFSLVSGARSAEKNFDNARLGHLFSLVSGARSAEKILLLQPWRAQRGPVLPLGQR